MRRCQRAERRVEDDVRGGRAAAEEKHGLAVALFLDPEARPVDGDVTAGSVGDGVQGVPGGGGRGVEPDHRVT